MIRNAVVAESGSSESVLLFGLVFRIFKNRVGLATVDSLRICHPHYDATQEVCN